MSDTNNTDKKPTPRKPMSLGGAGGKGPMRGNFSGGRTTAVVVQKKKRRLVGAPGAKSTPGGAPAGTPVTPSKPKPKVDPVVEAARKLGLSKEEYLKRKEAVDKAQAERTARENERRAEEAARQARAEADRKALEEKRKAEEEQKRREAEEAAARAEQEAREAEAKNDRNRDKPVEHQTPVKGEPRNSLEAMGGRVKKARQHQGKPSRTRTPDRSRRRGKLTIVSALAGDDERQRSLASLKRAREREKERRIGGGKQKEKVYREVVIPEAITVADLANRMAERTADVVKYLMQQGTMANANDVLDADTAQLIVEDFGHTVKRVAESDVEDNFLDMGEDPEDTLKPRPPVVAIMGHVDHGKTSLLDALRATDVASSEAGGITQHIGAYELELKSGDKITVLDTPGHAAFSAMRTRGAHAVDIVILVVAADDGVKPQTIESIKFAKEAGTAIIVAINKMDAYEADANKIEQQLLQHEIITESMSGEVQAVPVSALKKTGLDELTEAIILQAELLDLKANPDRRATGVVIESKVVKGRGPVATVLVQRGTLKRGEIVVAGDKWGKVKAVTDARGNRLKEAGPSSAVEILGLDGAPAPGEPFAVVGRESKAREITEYRKRQQKQSVSGATTTSMEQMLANLKSKKVEEIAVLVKGDVHGSVEAIRSSIEALGNDEVKARVVHGAVGGINESDVMLAKSTGAPIIGFNVRANRQAKALAEKEGVEIRYYSVIYDLLDDIKGVLEGLLEPERRETFIGYAEILQVFDISKLGKVAGCKVTEGKVERGAGVRLLRDDVVIHEGTLSTLKR
ncbi:MAG TPA: translation initiation factor IF-2, partial [Hellea balneolensis]|nr:translation initiation factor IF-2 [Hellea balneolensis]